MYIRVQEESEIIGYLRIRFEVLSLAQGGAAEIAWFLISQNTVSGFPVFRIS